MSAFYQDLCNMFIRPSRQKYQPYDLGNPLYQRIGRRHDFELTTHHHLKLKCSFYQNISHKDGPCVIYLHSFNGSRLQSIRYSGFLMDQGLNVCSFDFSGCGNSEGQFVSLGYHQKYDIMEVIKHISVKFQINKFVLWGRSMGASCIISFLQYLYQINKKQNITFTILCCIMDSPFCSLSRLAIQIAKKSISIPQFLLRAVFLVVKSTIQTKAQFKMDELQLLNYVPHIKCPVMILTSHEDTLVPSSHSQEIYKSLKSPSKELIFIKGEHHEIRQNQTIHRIITFILQHSNMYPIPKRIKRSISRNNFQQSSPIKMFDPLSIKKQHSRTQSYQQSPQQIVNIYNQIQYQVPRQTQIQYKTPKNYPQINKTIKQTPNIISHQFKNQSKLFKSENIKLNQIGQKNQTIQSQFKNKLPKQISTRLFQEPSPKSNQQHLNIINAKLKKKKKQFGKLQNPPILTESIHQLNKTCNVTMKNPKNYNSIIVQQQFTSKNNNNTAIPEKIFFKIQEPKNIKKYSEQRLYTCGFEDFEEQEKKHNQAPKIKNTGSLRNFDEMVSGIASRQASFINQIENEKKLKQKRQVQLNKSRKCVMIKTIKPLQVTSKE